MRERLVLRPRYTTMFESSGCTGSEIMPAPEKERLATEVMELWTDFQEGLSSEKRKYPKRQFDVFWNAASATPN